MGVPVHVPILRVMATEEGQTGNVFDTIYGTTAGGPGDTTRVLSINGYENAFPFYNLSYGLTVFMMLWVICMVTGFFMYRRVKQVQAA